MLPAYIVVVVQLLSHVQLFATPWSAAHRDSLSSTLSRSSLKFVSFELMMLWNHLILSAHINNNNLWTQLDLIRTRKLPRSTWRRN